MKKTLSVILAAGLVFVGAPAMATETTPPAFEVCYGEDILVSPAVEAIPAQDAVVGIIEHEATYKDVVTNPGQPFIETTYKQITVQEATPAQPEEFYTKYQYVKQTKTVRTHKNGKVEQVSDWSNWTPTSVQWSQTNPAVLETGRHATWSDGPWNYVRDYRYVPSGKTEKVVTKPAVPGTGAVYETVVDVPGQEYIAPTVETVVDVAAWTETVTIKEAVAAVPGKDAVHEKVAIDCPEIVAPPVVDSPVTPVPVPFKDCAEAGANGALPITPDNPRWSVILDSDKDGVSCESLTVESPTVTPSTPAPVPDASRPELAKTGFSAGGFAAIGAGLVALGIWLKRRTRRV